MGQYLLLLPIAFTVGFTIRDDLVDGRIYNKRVLQGLLAGGAAYVALGVAEMAGAGSVLCVTPAPGAHLHWSVAAAIDAGVGLVLGIVLWLLGIWAAGDAKLFALYAFLVPPSCYTMSYVEAFPALPLIVNVFAFVFVFLIVDLLRTGVPAVIRVLSDPEKRTRLLRRSPMALLRLLPALLTFTAMFAGIRSLREVSREGLSPVLEVSDFTLFVILFVVFRPLSRLIMSKWGGIVFAVLSMAAIAWLSWEHGIASLPDLLRPSALAVALLVFAKAYPGLGQTNMRVKVGDLRPGMFLSRETEATLRMREERELEEEGRNPRQASRSDPGTEARPSVLGHLTADGLDEEQVRYIRTRWHDDEPLLVARTIPFSPFLAAGALLTFFLGGPVTLLVDLS